MKKKTTFPTLLYGRFKTYIFTLLRLRTIRHERTFILLCLLFFLSLVLIPMSLLGKITLSLLYFLIPPLLFPLLLFHYHHFGTTTTEPTPENQPQSLHLHITLPPELLSHLQNQGLNPANPEAIHSFILDHLSQI